MLKLKSRHLTWGGPMCCLRNELSWKVLNLFPASLHFIELTTSTRKEDAKSIPSNIVLQLSFHYSQSSSWIIPVGLSGPQSWELASREAAISAGVTFLTIRTIADTRFSVSQYYSDNHHIVKCDFMVLHEWIAALKVHTYTHLASNK